MSSPNAAMSSPNAAMSSPNAAMSPSALLKRAFTAADNSEKNAAISTQTMVAGIFMFYAEMEGSKPKLCACLETGEAHTNFKANLIETMVKQGTITARISSAEKKADPTLLDAVVFAANTKNNAQITKLSLAFKLARDLYAAGITSESYDAVRGLFCVPVSALIGNAEPRLVLKSIAAGTNKKCPDQRVPLNGAWYEAETEEKSFKLRALPAQVIKVAKEAGIIPTLTKAPAASKGASDTATTGGASAEEVKTTATTWSYDKLVSEAAKLLNLAADISVEGDAVSFASLPEATRNALNAIALFRDECMAEDAKSKKVA